MQKLPVAPDSKVSEAYTKKKWNCLSKRKKPFSFQQWAAKSKHLNLPCF